MSIFDHLFSGNRTRRSRSNRNSGRPQSPAPTALGPRRPAQPTRYSGIITIHRVGSPTVTAPTSRNVRVVDRDVGKGIHISRQKDPTICPQCRTPNRIEKVRNTKPEWRCGVCGHEF